MIDRNIFESAIWRESPETLKLFIWLIGKARSSKTPKKYPHFEIKRGELVTSFNDISEGNEYYYQKAIRRWSNSKISRMLDKLKKGENRYIEVIRDTYGTHIKICNYDIYQDPGRYKRDNTGTKRDNTGTKPETNNNGNNDNNGNKTFDYFWKYYPGRNTDKKKCLAKWKRDNLDSKMEEIMNGLGNQIDVRNDIPSNEFKPQWKNPLTWLNGECWKDDFSSGQNLDGETD